MAQPDRRERRCNCSSRRAGMGLLATDQAETDAPSPLANLRRAAARCWALLLVRIYECLPLRDSQLVRITKDKTGRWLERDDQFLIDLADSRKQEVADFLSMNIDPDGKPAAGARDPGEGEPKSIDDVLSDAAI